MSESPDAAVHTIVEVVPDALAGERLDRAVALLADLPRAVAASLVDEGGVRVDDTVVTRRSHRLEAGEVVRFDRPAAVVEQPLVADATVTFDIVHTDEHLLVVDKPAGLVVHPGPGNMAGTLVHGLLARHPELAGIGPVHRPGIVHRLDKDTSGLMVVARTPRAHSALGRALRRREVTRRYRALVWGRVDEPRGQVDAPIGRSPKDPTRMAVVVGGRESRTGYEVVRRFEAPVEVTELVCLLETGRTHQIRVHLAAIGHPVVGDGRYRGARKPLAGTRQFLHAEHLSFAHPVDGAPVSFDSALPPDLAAVLDQLS